MSFKEQKELENLPQTIEQLETELSDLNEAMAQPGFYQQSRDDISRCESELADKQLKLESAYLRWEMLEALREASEH
jgi:ATP-binding cassette subfamily F protein uup